MLKSNQLAVTMQPSKNLTASQWMLKSNWTHIKNLSKLNNKTSPVGADLSKLRLKKQKQKWIKNL
jgi:hypothetical protein